MRPPEESEVDAGNLPALASATPARRKAFRHPRRALLTGATGFLGRYLLERLLEHGLEATCLVRAHGSIRAASGLSSAVHVIHGDLGAPRFGLSEPEFDSLARTTDVILHAGASTSFVDSFVSLKRPNVLGTKTAIELSLRGGGIPLHHVSTLAVIGDGGRDATAVCGRASFDRLAGAYAQSKWIAEELVERARALGVPATIYRPGNIAADRRTGCCNERDFLYHLFKSSLVLERIPAMDFPLDWIPVDVVSERIAARAAGGELPAVEHLCHPAGISARRLIDLACQEWSVKIVDEAEWLRRVADMGPRAPGFPLVGFIRDVGGLAAVLKRVDVAPTDIPWDGEIEEETLRAYLRHVRETAA